ncbi:hybrid sensor histidine kinase/response regulator transcription factor [Salinimicrobium terrae]|uniref:hybrid sensor histidine kinase/response regulator transcription factor n=1 Tax=Salinimicrobium terrae TaxID=470866 RepID=UPI00146BE690|nr:two-component regulator propeller domain-containing protein [Salinimicrobium terrae]
MPQTQYRFSHLGISDGLSTGSVNCFYRDSKGFLWIGTSSGLNRFDGYNIEIFNPDPSDTLILQSKDYHKIFEGPFGNLWVQNVLGFSIFDSTTEKFSANQFDLLKKMGLPQKEVKEMYKDSKGNYWFLQEGEGISRYSANTGKVDRYTSSGEEGSVSTNDISWFSEDSKGNFWFIHTNGIFEKLNGKTHEVDYRNTEFYEAFGGDLYDYRLIVDNDNDLWIHLHEDFGIFHFDAEKDLIKNYNKNTTPISLNSNLIRDVVKDQDGNIWIGTDHGGITVIKKEDLTVDYIVTNPEIENSLSHNSLTSLYADPNGIIWAGTYKNGVDYYNKNIKRFAHHQNLISNPGSLPFNDINVFAEDDNGNIWIGTNGGGLLSLDLKTWNYKQYLHDPEDPTSISNDVIVSLLYDSQGNLWAGTFLGGLNKFNGREFKHYNKKDKDPIGIGGNSIWELFEDSRGNIWVGTLDGGVDVFDPKTEEFRNSSEKGGVYSVHCNYISAITEDQNGNIWIGGVNGIDVINPLTGESKHFLNDPKDCGTLSSNQVLSIFRDSDDKIWVGTQEGLDLYNPKTQTFYHYTVLDGLPGKKVISVNEDNEKNLWLSTSYGLVQFKKNKIEKSTGRIAPNFQNYDDEDGLQGKLFNENALFRTRNGTLLAGGLNGFNMFNPEKFTFNNEPPNVVFTSFELFNKKIKPFQKINGRVLLNAPIHQTSEVKLQYDENLFSIEFAALDFLQPSKNKYRYKLEGFDQEWQEVGSSDRRVTYTNLDPGTYEFQVQASNNDKVWNIEDASLMLTVLPPFYKTTYAYVAYLFLGILILHFSRRNIIRRQRRNFLFEQEKREAAHLHEMDLMKIRFFTNISHEFKTPLSLIIAPIEKLKAREINIEAREQLETINRNAKRLYGLINEILDLRKVQNTPLLSTSRGNVIEFVEQIVESFKILGENKNIDLNIQSETKEFVTSFDMDKLDKILFNLLSNAFKFTPEQGIITVNLRIADTATTSGKKLLQITISDTGIGISSEDQAKIFDRFYKVPQPENYNRSGSGIGLSLVKEFVELYEGTISVQSELGKGSVFSLSIPLEDLQCPDMIREETGSGNKGAKVATVKGAVESIENSEIPRLLIIEDDQNLLTYLTKNFNNSFKVFVAANGQDGWKKALAVQPDLIISDWSMPVMDGTELCTKIRNDSRTRHIPFILLTAHADEESILCGLKTGVSDYIVKPFNLEVLHSRVQNLISQRKSLQQTYSKKIEVATKKVELEPEDDAFMRKALKIIDKNIGNTEFSVEKMAADLGVSRTFLYNKMVTRLEKSPHELIRDIRLDRGKELLLKSQLTISEIAFEVGYNNPKYFTKNYKKKYNVLPSEVRAQVLCN